MTDDPEEPFELTVADVREREQRFDAWVKQLRRSDPQFAEASRFYPCDMGEWQAAVYLLTGCREVWTRLGPAVRAERSIAPVLGELEHSDRAWSSSEEAVMRWAIHFWDVDQRATNFPCSFGSFYFHRWITAVYLRRRLLPALTVTDESQ